MERFYSTKSLWIAVYMDLTLDLLTYKYIVRYVSHACWVVVVVVVKEVHMYPERALSDAHVVDNLTAFVVFQTNRENGNCNCHVIMG